MKKIITLLMLILVVSCEKEGDEFSIVGKRYSWSPQTVSVDGEYVHYVYLFINGATVEKQTRVGSPSGRLLTESAVCTYHLDYPSLSINDGGVITEYTFISESLFRNGRYEYTEVN